MREAPSPLWRNRDFMLVWCGEALSELGSQVSTIAFPLLVLALGGTAAQAGVVGFAKTLPLLVAALPAGALADRVDRKRLMIACDAGRALALASVPLALALGRPPFAQLALVAFVDGCLFATAYIAERGALRQLVPADQLAHAVAQNESRTFAASIVGPPLGGVLFGIARFLPFAVDAASYAGSSLALSRTRTSFQEPDSTREPATLRGLVHGVEWLWRRPFFRASALLFAGGNPLFTGLYLFAVLLAEHHGASSAEVGVMFAIIGAGGLIGTVIAAPLRRRVSSGRSLAGENWLIAAVLPLLTVVHAPVGIGLVVAATELLTPLNNSIVSGHRVALTPDRLQGRVQAAGMLVTQSLGWLGPLAVGVAFGNAGPTATVLGLAGWALVLALAATATPALRTAPAIPRPAEEDG